MLNDKMLRILINHSPNDTVSPSGKFDRYEGLFRDIDSEYSSLGNCDRSPLGRDIYHHHYVLSGRRQSIKPLTYYPERYRELRHKLYETKKCGGSIHVFGVLDLDSTAGSRKDLEVLVRDVVHTGLPIRLHLGIYYPSPTEYRRGINELIELSKAYRNIIIDSIFLLPEVLNETVAKNVAGKYISDKDGGICTNIYDYYDVPPKQTIFFSLERIKNNDIVLFASDQFGSLNVFANALADERDVTLYFYDSSNPTISAGLENIHQHVIVAGHDPLIMSYYLPNKGIDSPYVEHIRVDRPDEMLEMFASPHWGYHELPRLTLMAIDDIPQSSLSALEAMVARWQKEAADIALIHIVPFSYRPLDVVRNTRCADSFRQNIFAGVEL